MDFLLVTMLSVGIFVGYNAQPAGNLNFVCRHEEEFHMCRSPCEPTCSRVKVNCSQSCIAGCFCRDGLIRASNRACVSPEECTKRTIPECKENEEFLECGSPCVVNCSNINDPIFCTKPCHSGCFCKPNFVRDSKGNCVHPRKCSTAGYGQCPMNEHYVRCVNFCNTCWESGDCRSHNCIPGCDCKPGFYRNIYGQCVTIEECLAPLYDSSYPGLPGNCAENEIYSDCVNLCNDCVSKGICNYEFYCTPGCDCKSGYLRDERGVCVPENFCLRRCSEDRVFNQCGPSCVSTCENYKRLLYHPCKQECVPGCFCPRNLVLGPNGRCIEPKYCPSERPVCPPDQQYYDCIPTCRATCETYNDPCVISDKSCIKGCFCMGGLVRRQDGRCVIPKDCPARPPTCPPEEAFYQCLPTCRTTCETLNTSIGMCATECKPGCFCQPGFVRNKEGICVLPKECPQPFRPTCPTGEVYYKCVPTCHNTCDNWNLPRRCVKICLPGCFCRRGFVRNRDGKCVRTRNCPIVCGANEEFRSCGSPCPVTCSNFHERTACVHRCARGCFCKRGFVLGPNDRCIKPENCPADLTTPDSVSVDTRRSETEEEVLMDETKTAPSLSAKTTQSVTNKPTQSDMTDTASLADSTKLSSSTATDSTIASTVLLSETTNSASISTVLPSETTDSASISTVLPSETADSASISTVLPSESADSASISTVLPSETTDSASISTILPSEATDSAYAATVSTSTDLAFGETDRASTAMNLTSDEVIVTTNADETEKPSPIKTTPIELTSKIPSEKTLAEDIITSETNATETTDGHILTTNYSVILGNVTSANFTA